MHMERDSQPVLYEDAFACPHCSVVSKQDWNNVSRQADVVHELLSLGILDFKRDWPQSQIDAERLEQRLNQIFRQALPSAFSIPSDITFSICHNCSQYAIWREEERIFPRALPFPDPNDDMCEDVKKLYREAAAVHGDSPRASAALLRLCLEELCRQLGEHGKLNTSIGNLVAMGLNDNIRQALDYCRITGNSAVHDAGKIDVTEDPQVTPTMFFLINDIANDLITRPRQMNERYRSLPEAKRRAIEDRDKKP